MSNVSITAHNDTVPDRHEISDRTAEGAKGYSPEEVYRELQERLDRAHDVDESERHSLEWALFTDWAHERGVCYYPPGNAEQNQGGHEHLVFFQGAYCLKATRLDMAGYAYDPELGGLCNATVSEYLLRLWYQDLFFLSDTEVLGVIVDGNSRSVLTRQRIIEGRIPTEEELHSMLEQMEAIRLSSGSGGGYMGAVYYYMGHYIADVRADNCRIIACRKGEKCLASFDLVITPVQRTEADDQGRS